VGGLVFVSGEGATLCASLLGIKLSLINGGRVT